MTANPKDLVFTPEESAYTALDYIRRRVEAARSGFPGVTFGLEKVDRFLLPLLPGQLCSILGRPGNGKTAILVYWARFWTRVLQANPNLWPKGCVVYASAEQSAEELNSFLAAASTGINVEDMARGRLSDDQLQQVAKWSAARSTEPILFVGRSQSRRKSRVRLFLENVTLALQSIEEEFDRVPALVLLDYLQIFRYKSRESKTVGVSDNVQEAKDIAGMFMCPVVMGVQARREVDQKNPPMPSLEDPQWTSGIEQDSDTVLATTRPSQYRGEGQSFGDYTVQGHNQLILSILKQRMARANIAVMISMDPRYNKFDEYEERQARLDTD